MSQVACDHSLALHASILAQYMAQLSLYLHGNLGTTNLGHPVTGLLRSTAPATALLWLVTLPILAILRLAGRASIRRLGGDPAVTALEVVRATPAFWGALMILYGAAYSVHLLPITHAQSATIPAAGSRLWLHALVANPRLILGDFLLHMALPACCLSMIIACGQAQVTSATRRAGMSEGGRWAARPLSRMLPLWIGATVIIESIFELNGLGYLFARSLAYQDYAVVLALFLLASLVCCTVALLVSAMDGKRGTASHDAESLPANAV